MKWAIMALMLLLAPMAFGISCNNLDADIDAQCNEIKSSTLAEPEKQHLLNGLAYPASSNANHSIVYDWNTKIQFNEAPEGAQKVSNGYIKGAWLKTISVMPSVISKDRLLTPGIGTIQNAYNYRVEMPSGTDSGDCRTEFSIRREQASLNVFLNGNPIGTSILTEYQGSGTLNFKTTLSIIYEIEAKHYKNFRYCCRPSRRGCNGYCDDCRYDNTEVWSNTVNLEDTKIAYQHWPIIKANIRGIDKYRETYVGILNISNFDSFRLDFENSSLSQSNYYYGAELSLPPYNVMTLKANNFSSKKSENINYQFANSIYKFYVANPVECKLKYSSHFSSWEQDCSLKFDFPEMSIETDKNQYNPKEPISVKLEPKNTLVKVRYGNEEKSAQNEVQFEAKKNNNKIIVNLNDREVEKVIHVKNEDTWDFALNFGVFSSVIYAFYFAIKKSWGALL